MKRLILVGLACCGAMAAISAPVTITKQWTSNGVVVGADLKFTREVCATPFRLYYAYGSTDASAISTNGWDHVFSYGTFAASTETVHCDLPVDAYAPNEWSLATRRRGRFVAMSIHEGQGYDADSYVCTTEGAELIAQWDGLDDTKTETAWTDRKGYRVITFTEGVVMNEASYGFGGSSSQYGTLSAEDTMAVFGGDELTVEMVILRKSSNQHIMLKTPYACGVAMGISGGSAMFTAFSGPNETGNCFNYSESGNITSLAVTYSAHAPVTGYKGGENMGSRGLNCWGQEVDNAFIGRRGTGSSDSAYEGDIYALRVYSGKLSAEDIAQHARVDTERFVSSGSSYASDLITPGALYVKALRIALIENDAQGIPVAVNLAFDGFAAADSALYAAYDVKDRGNTTNGWAEVVKIAEITQETTALRVPLPEGLGTDWMVARYFVCERTDYTAADYSGNDSMLAQWDGADFEAASGKWVDRLNGRAFTLKDVTATDDGKGLVFNGSSSGGALSPDDSQVTFEGSGDKTLEIVVAFDDGGQMIALKSKLDPDSGIAFGVAGSTVIVYSGSGNQSTYGKLGGAESYCTLYSSAKPVTCYQNGFEMDAVGGDCFGQEVDTTYLGYRGEGTTSQSWLNGRIYAIRLYSGMLSESQLAHNAAIDRIRFLGATPAIVASEAVTMPRPVVITGQHKVTGRLVSCDLSFVREGEHPAMLYVVDGNQKGGATTNGWAHVTAVGAVMPQDVSMSGVSVPARWANKESAYFRYVLVEDYSAASADDYAAKDALIAHWDSHARGSDDAQWPDLVNGRAFAITNPKWQDNALEFDGTATTYGVLPEADTQAIHSALTNDAQTLECVLMARNGSTIFFKAPTAMGSAVSFFDRYLVPWSGNVNRDGYEFNESYKKKVSISVNFTAGTYNDASTFLPDGAWLNGEPMKVKPNYDACYNDETCIQLGRRTVGSANGANGSLQAIRIYNRALTDRERAHNAMVDALRFGWAEVKPCNGVTASELFGRPGLIVVIH